MEHKFKTKSGLNIRQTIPLAYSDFCVYCNCSFEKITSLLVNTDIDIDNDTISTSMLNSGELNILPCLTEEEYIIKLILE